MLLTNSCQFLQVLNEFEFKGYDNKTHKMYVSEWEYFNCTDDVTTFTLQVSMGNIEPDMGLGN